MNIFDYPIHPAAEIFPMLDEEELAELAEDIRQNGLVHPLVVKDGVLIDGRNRREACRRAGITPHVVELDGQDPASYILSANINRRHLTKSQRAMAVAMVFPEPAKGGRGKKNSSKLEEFKDGRISEARTVLKWTPALAPAVLSGDKPLNEAYEEARTIKERVDELPDRLDRLRKAAPDLSELVKEEKLSINEAESALGERRAQERRIRQGVWDFLQHLEIDRPILATQAQNDYIVQTYRIHKKEYLSQSDVSVTEILDDWIAGLTRIRKAL